MKAALLQKRASNELEPAEWMELFDHFKHQGEVRESLGVEGQVGVVTSSQYDDWLHRGPDPLVAPLSLYLYSMWVYRVEKPERPSPDDFLIEFASTYPLKARCARLHCK